MVLQKVSACEVITIKDAARHEVSLRGAGGREELRRGHSQETVQETGSQGATYIHSRVALHPSQFSTTRTRTLMTPKVPSKLSS